MLDIQTPFIGKTYLVIGVIFSAMLLGPFTSRKIASALPGRNKQQTSSELDTASNIAKQAMLSTAIYLFTMFLMVVVVMVSIFMFYLVAKDVTLGETFTKTFETLNKYLWMDGQLTFAYIPIILSSIVLLIVFMSYAWSNSDFVSNIEFASVNNGFMTSKKKSNQNISRYDWFRKHYILLIFIASLFIYTIIFVPLWNMDKVLYVKCMTLILMILVSSMATLRKWWVMFIVYTLIAIGYVSSP
jgi:hypothetical protein